MKVTLAQLNPVVGDIEGNLAKLKEATKVAVADGSSLLILPELFLTGYPPKDLLEKDWFIKRCEKGIEEVLKLSCQNPGLGTILGVPIRTGSGAGRGLYNAALLFKGGRIVFSQAKSLLPAYDVFDEARYFDSAKEVSTHDLDGKRLAITICEDGWSNPDSSKRRPYNEDPIGFQASELKAELLINISASPFEVGKEAERFSIFQSHSKAHHLPLVFVNQIGGNDELIFDGASFALDTRGNPIEILPSFTEAVKTIDLIESGDMNRRSPLSRMEEVHRAIILGVSDYFRKTGFTGAVIGLSGGIDSAVTCALAAQALGAKNVMGVSMPGPFSSKGSLRDAKGLAKNLSIEYRVIPIDSINSAYLESLKPEFEGLAPNEAEENIQARIRGNILMALSNKFGHLVLATGNKSEMAVGYSTLYGDMSGGLAVIADLPKTAVYELAAYLNREAEIIPPSTIEKVPSAELRADQRDQDTLPPYEILDAILELYVDEGLSISQIVEKGFDFTTVGWVARAVNLAEHKRRQAPPGLKLTSKSFGSGRRMPIAAKYNPS
ncbi:MAG: NAD+ synthase [Actinomycetota bacterium]|nr:NAD+ synthase [Actinomycetota bacterium]